MVKINCSGKTDVGLRRKNNEDSFIILPEYGLSMVADGMGGAAAGELASSIFVETSVDVFKNADGRSENETEELVRIAFQKANTKILEHVLRYPDHKGMGCTAELFATSDIGFVIGHVGDSRTYRFRNHQLKQLTRDHSFVQDQIDQGIITKDEARKHPHRNVINRAVGIRESLALDILKGKSLTGDTFLQCSDGLSDMIDDEIIFKIMSSYIDLDERVDYFINLAKSAGGKDNITVALSEIL